MAKKEIFDRTPAQVFFIGALPVIGLAHVNAFVLPEHQERPEFVDYDHLRLITYDPNLILNFLLESVCTGI